jgi:hypothetical protein
MTIRNRLNYKAQKLLGELNRFLGRKTAPKPKEIRAAVLLRLESGISRDEQRPLFPFRKIDITLFPPTNRTREEYRKDFLVNGSLESDIRGFLKDAGVEPVNPEISVRFRSGQHSADRSTDPASMFEMKFLDPPKPVKPEIPDLLLEILKGTAERPVYRISKDRLLVGCLPEVHDLEGRLVRKNNIVFPHGGDENNSTVGNMHARIWFDSKKQEFRVMDESSRFGTRIVREEHTIEVPPENPHGVGLRSGDAVYFGQACLRFSVVKKAD